jgi:signal transduction histidine kinase/ActR/RegA family two-component response regulator
VTPPIVFTALLNVFLVVMFVCIGYALYVNLRAARNRRSGSLYALLSTVIMLMILLLSNLHYFGLIPPLKLLVFAGYLAFFFLQSLALSHRFADTFKKATLQAQQGLKAKSEFLSTMSHEIRTPLNAVIGMTHLLLGNKPRTDQKEDLDVLLFSANNLLSIVNNILDYNKIEEGKISFEQIPMDLTAISRNIVAGLKTAAHEKGIALLMEIDGRLDKKLIGDPTRISQVINNLVHNAIKFTREGSVRLLLHVNYQSAGSAIVTIRVEDTGIGIAKEKQNMIFDRFTQADSSTSRSYGGTGLGLAITKRILELQSVKLQLESEPGKGSVFYFTQDFPVSNEKAGERHDEPDSYRKSHLLKGVSLLLVEDNPLNVLVAQTILENCGATVDVAGNGQEALDMLDTSRHQLVLMDLHMPVMDGYEATVLLRKRGYTLPIIALTASTPKEVESEAFAAGLTDVVVKPFNPDDLYRVILQHIPSKTHPVAGS